MRSNNTYARTMAALMVMLFLTLIAATQTSAQISGLRVVVNLPGHTLRVYEHGILKREFPVAIGATSAPTPVGITTVKNRVENPVYYPPNWGELGLEPVPPGPDNPVGSVWIGLEWPGYGIHGTNAPSSIGRTVSLGCIRMHNRHVEELYTIVRVGTPVEIAYNVVELISLADPWPSLRIHADVYNRKPDYFQEAARLLYPLGIWELVDEDALRQQIEARPDSPFLVPRRGSDSTLRKAQ